MTGGGGPRWAGTPDPILGFGGRVGGLTSPCDCIKKEGAASSMFGSDCSCPITGGRGFNKTLLGTFWSVLQG